MAGFQLTLYGRIWVTPKVVINSSIPEHSRVARRVAPHVMEYGYPWNRQPKIGWKAKDPSRLVEILCEFISNLVQIIRRASSIDLFRVNLHITFTFDNLTAH
jgi:hypothetical protein